MFSKKAKKEKKKVRLGNDFLSDWEDLDKEEIQEHEQIKQLEECVRKGLVTQDMYEKLVRETKEKRLGLYKKREIKEKYHEKPIIQGYLFHRIKKNKTRYIWKKFHFTLYRARLEWRKKKDSKKVFNSLLLNKDFSLEELQTISRTNLPIAQQGSRGSARTNKNSMRFSFELLCIDQSWQFAAETDALKKYWFHTLGLQINRIIERSLLTDQPLLMTTRPKLQSMPEDVAQSVRDYNLQQSTKNLKMASKQSQRSRFMSKQSTKAKTNTYFPTKDIDNETSVSQTRSTKVIMYLPKEAVLKNPNLYDEERSKDSKGMPILEVGDKVILNKSGEYKEIKKTSSLESEKPTKSTIQRIKKQLTLAKESEKSDTIQIRKKKNKVKLVETRLGLRNRSPSFDDRLTISIKDLRKKLGQQDKKITKLNNALEIVTLQKQMLESEYKEAKTGEDEVVLQRAKEGYERAKELELMQEELIGAASLKKEQLKEMINKKEKEMKKSELTKEIINEVDDVDNDVTKAAEEILLETIRKEELLALKASQARHAVKLARETEKNCRNDIERTLELQKFAVEETIQKKAAELLIIAEKKCEQAVEDRIEKEQLWAEAVEDGINMRMKAFEIKKALQPKPTSRRKKKISRKISTDPPPGLTRPNKSSIHALADFMNNNAKLDEVERKPIAQKKASKLQNFLSTSLMDNVVEETEVVEEETEVEDEESEPKNIKEIQEGQVAVVDDYGDYTESFYSSEAGKGIDGSSFIKAVEENDYFESKTKHISEVAKKELSEKFIAQEIDRLCQVIADVGAIDDDRVFVFYSTLRDEYKNISDGLNGILIKAKNQGRVEYEGTFLLQEEDGNTKIYLV